MRLFYQAATLELGDDATGRFSGSADDRADVLALRHDTPFTIVQGGRQLDQQPRQARGRISGREVNNKSIGFVDVSLPALDQLLVNLRIADADAANDFGLDPAYVDRRNRDRCVMVCPVHRGQPAHAHCR